MPKDQVCNDVFVTFKRERCLGGWLRFGCLCPVAALSFLLPRLGYSQGNDRPDVTNMAAVPNEVTEAGGGVTQPRAGRPAVASEIAVTTMLPDGDYRLFGATVRCYAWTVGIEYDRHSWGHLLGSQLDYVVEAIPFILLSQPAVSDFWGNAKSPNQELVHGISLSPFGFRMLWRSNRGIKPYVTGKLGSAVFAKKAFSQSASYVNFSVQAELGVQIRMTNRIDLRIEPFEFFHVSNGYLAASNPGMDELGTKFGISYHLGRRGE